MRSPTAAIQLPADADGEPRPLRAQRCHLSGQQRDDHREAACRPCNRDEAAGAAVNSVPLANPCSVPMAAAKPRTAAKGSRKSAATAAPASAVAAAVAHKGMAGTPSAHPAIIPIIHAAGSAARSHRP